MALPDSSWPEFEETTPPIVKVYGQWWYALPCGCLERAGNQTLEKIWCSGHGVGSTRYVR